MPVSRVPRQEAEPHRTVPRDCCRTDLTKASKVAVGYLLRARLSNTAGTRADTASFVPRLVVWEHWWQCNTSSTPVKNTSSTTVGESPPTGLRANAPWICIRTSRKSCSLGRPAKEEVPGLSPKPSSRAVHRDLFISTAAAEDPVRHVLTIPRPCRARQMARRSCAGGLRLRAHSVSVSTDKQSPRSI